MMEEANAPRAGSMRAWGILLVFLAAAGLYSLAEGLTNLDGGVIPAWAQQAQDWRMIEYEQVDAGQYQSYQIAEGCLLLALAAALGLIGIRTVRDQTDAKRAESAVTAVRNDSCLNACRSGLREDKAR